jgi:ribose transport system substrate-binding protein
MRKAVGAVVVALSLAVLASACATTEATETTDRPAASGDSGSAELLEEARANLEKHSVTPEFEPPGEPFDARAVMQGKTIASIPVNSAIDFTQFYKQAAERIAAEVGFEFRSWPNQGRPSEWAQGMQSALSDGADLIELFAGIDPSMVAPQMAAAADAGVPVVASDTYDLTQESAPGLAAAVDCPCSTAGRLMADWVAVATEGTGNVLVLTSSDVKASAAQEEAIKDQFSRVCPECRVEYMDIPSADWATKILPQVQSALVADPEIDYVLPVFDTMSIWTVQAITQAGRQDRVRIATYNGTPSILKLMGESDLIEMNVGQSNDWMAYVTVDQLMRTLGGLPTNEDATWPLYIWTKDNLAEAGDPPSDSEGYGEEYQAGFRELWGLR